MTPEVPRPPSPVSRLPYPLPPINQHLELLHLLNLSQSSLPAGRLQRWAEAYQAWIGERRARFSPTTSQLSYTAWREFLDLIRKLPWEATAADVEAYIAALEQSKLRRGTITCRLAALSQFYKYCQAKRIDPEREAVFNSVAAARKPGSERYQRANYLSQ
jgi:hypothetical protein